MKRFVTLVTVLLMLAPVLLTGNDNPGAMDEEEPGRSFIQTPVQTFNLTFLPPSFYSGREHDNTYDDIAFVVLVRENTTALVNANENQSNDKMLIQEIYQSLFVTLPMSGWPFPQIAQFLAQTNHTIRDQRHLRLYSALADVLKVLGQPAEKTELVKGPEPIFGVVETWWATLTDGDKIEIWRYPKPEGMLQIYFLNDCETVWHTAFVGKNVVF